MRSKHFVFSPRAYHSLIKKVMKHGEKASPRGIPTYELINSTLLVHNPIDRIASNRGRRMNIAFAFAEWYAVMFGIDDITFFERFISDYKKYSSDGIKLDGAYGTRIHYSVAQPVSSFSPPVDLRFDQIICVIDMLKKDPSSRRAVISIYAAKDLAEKYGGVNTPCTLTLQFLIRDRCLHLIVNMRSSDIVRGLTYDVVVFTMLQEYIARQLDVELGKYFHNAASLHLYTEDLGMVKQLTRARWPYIMYPMPKLSDTDLSLLYHAVRRGKGLDKTDKEWNNDIGLYPKSLGLEYVRTIAETMRSFVNRRQNPDMSRTAYFNVADPTIRYVLRPWLVRAGVLKASRRK